MDMDKQYEYIANMNSNFSKTAAQVEKNSDSNEEQLKTIILHTFIIGEFDSSNYVY